MKRNYTFSEEFVDPLMTWFNDRFRWYCYYCRKHHNYSRVQYVLSKTTRGHAVAHEVPPVNARFVTGERCVCHKGAEYIEEHNPVLYTYRRLK